MEFNQIYFFAYKRMLKTIFVIYAEPLNSLFDLTRFFVVHGILSLGFDLRY